MRIVDLTHGFSEGMPSYPADWFPPFSFDRAMTPQTDPYGTNRTFSTLHIFPHNGTHIEYKLHFYPGTEGIGEVPLETLIGRTCVADLSHKGDLEPVTAEDLDKAVGDLWTPGDRLLVRTDYLRDNWGAADYWDRPPYMTPSAAQWAIDNGAVLVGFDCLTERPGDAESPVHHALLAAGIPILEYVANLHELRQPVVQLFALPIKVADVEAAPARVVALEHADAAAATGGGADMTTTVESPAFLRSGLRPGDVVHRHESRGPDVDAVVAAAALRGSDRIMLSCRAAETGPVVLIAVGELAVARRVGHRRDPSAPAPVTAAIDFLDGLEFASGAGPDERSWYGCIGYDAVTDFERLSLQSTSLPTYDLFLPEVLVRFDRTGTTVVGRGATAPAARGAAERVERVLRGAGEFAQTPTRAGAGTFGHGVDEYLEAVRRAKEYILAGDIFQVVLSTRYSAPAEADGLTVYRRLAEFNRSPYHFYYRSTDFEVVGASPEPCVTLTGRDVLIRPLAGTRPRGADRAADLMAEQDLLSSEKELAEHRMLVDLARNDLGRVCAPSTVRVPRLMEVERYSHVMHMTSDVRGRLRPGCRTDDLVRASFPAGTMTGAPKVRAIEIIDELEPVGRGLYSGAVGSFGVGHADLYLTIRALVVHDGGIHLQAGGGIVYDSDPLAEREECLAKLRAAARAAAVSLGAGDQA